MGENDLKWGSVENKNANYMSTLCMLYFLIVLFFILTIQQFVLIMNFDPFSSIVKIKQKMNANGCNCWAIAITKSWSQICIFCLKVCVALW